MQVLTGSGMEDDLNTEYWTQHQGSRKANRGSFLLWCLTGLGYLLAAEPRTPNRLRNSIVKLAVEPPPRSSKRSLGPASIASALNERTHLRPMFKLL